MELVDPAAHIIVLALNKLPHFWPQSWLVRIWTSAAFNVSELYPPIFITTINPNLSLKKLNENYD
jgi:hypothetical protein